MVYIIVPAYAESRLQSLEPESGRPRARSDVEKQLRFFFAGHLLEHLPEIGDSLIFLVVVFIDCELSHFVYVEIRVRPGNDQVELLIAKHGQPLRLHYLQKALSEYSRLLLYLLVALEIRVTHNEVYFGLTKSHLKYFVT